MGGVVRLREEWARIFVQPLKLSIFEVRVLLQQLPVCMGSHIRLRRRRRIPRELGYKKLVGLFRKRESPD